MWQSQFSMFVLYLRSYRNISHLILQNTIFKGDLTSDKDVSDAINQSKCDVIVHSASPMHGLPQEIYEKVNVQGTKICFQ